MGSAARRGGLAIMLLGLLLAVGCVRAQNMDDFFANLGQGNLGGARGLDDLEGIIGDLFDRESSTPPLRWVLPSSCVFECRGGQLTPAATLRQRRGWDGRTAAAPTRRAVLHPSTQEWSFLFPLRCPHAHRLQSCLARAPLRAAWLTRC
jgi:hypothetical protein